MAQDGLSTRNAGGLSPAGTTPKYGRESVLGAKMSSTMTTKLGDLTDLSAAALLVKSEVIPLALAERDNLRFANAAFLDLFGRANDVDGTSIFDLLEPSDREQVGRALRGVVERPVECLATAIRGDGSRFSAELHFSEVEYQGGVLLAIFAQDVTDRFRQAAQLSLLAYSDPLTGLANRAMFADRLHQATVAARRGNSNFAVLALDLDGLKSVNDRYGHDSGDLVLERIGQRLLACLRDTDTVARIGGDEFEIMLPNAKNPDDVTITARRLIEAVKVPIGLQRDVVTVGVSIGIAMFPEHAPSVEHLLAAADQALYAAKRQGGGRFAWASAQTLSASVPPPLPWSINHEVGVPEIDEQHAKLASLLNGLGAALLNAQPHEALLAEVVRYTAFHFASEECLMDDCAYRGAAVHRELHRQLLEDVRSLKLDEETMSVSLILRFLQEWLIRHIDGADRDLAAALLAARAKENDPAVI